MKIEMMKIKKSRKGLGNRKSSCQSWTSNDSLIEGQRMLYSNPSFEDDSSSSDSGRKSPWNSVNSGNSSSSDESRSDGSFDAEEFQRAVQDLSFEILDMQESIERFPSFPSVDQFGPIEPRFQVEVPVKPKSKFSKISKLFKSSKSQSKSTSRDNTKLSGNTATPKLNEISIDADFPDVPDHPIFV